MTTPIQDIKDDVRAWVQSVTSLTTAEVLWTGPNLRRPVTPHLILTAISVPQIGSDDVYQNPESETGVNLTIDRLQQMTVEIDGYLEGSDGLLVAVVDGLTTQTGRDAMGDLEIQTAGPIVPHDSLNLAVIAPLYSLEITAQWVKRTEFTEAETGSIERVIAVGTVDALTVTIDEAIAGHTEP